MSSQADVSPRKPHSVLMHITPDHSHPGWSVCSCPLLVRIGAVHRRGREKQGTGLEIPAGKGTRSPQPPESPLNAPQSAQSLQGWDMLRKQLWLARNHERNKADMSSPHLAQGVNGLLLWMESIVKKPLMNMYESWQSTFTGGGWVNWIFWFKVTRLTMFNLFPVLLWPLLYLILKIFLTPFAPNCP